MKAVSKYISQVIKNEYFYGTVVVGIGTVIGSFLSYLLQFFLGRMLSVEDFGSFNALLSVSTILGVPAAVVGISLVKVVATLKANADYPKLNALFKKLSIQFLLLGVVVYALATLFSGYVASQLKIDNPSYINAFNIYLAFLFLNAIAGSYLQGLLKYKSLSFFFIISSLFRLVLPLIGIYIGYEVAGVFGGMSVAMLLSYATTYLLIKEDLGKKVDNHLSVQFKKLLTFSLPVFFINLGIMSLNNMDVILVKKFFDPTLAGYYAGTVTLGKIYLFGAGIVTTIMFPIISSVYAKKENYKAKFFKLLSIEVFVALCGLLAFSFLPGLITQIFFGSRFFDSIQYLPRFSIFVLFYVLINFFIMYCLAIEKTWVFIFLLPGLLIQYILISVNHASLYDVINANIIASIITLGLLTIYAQKTKHTT